MAKIAYSGLPNCYRLANDTVEVVVTTDVGPRILRYALHGAENMLGEVPGVVLTTALGDWQPWGGHRLWAAPEAMPRSYAPDNAPLSYTTDGARAVHLTAPPEAQVGIQKEMLVTLDATGSGLTVEQRITNHNLWPVELALWGITILRGGGEVIIPHEPFRTWSQELLPARPLVLWHYTDMADARFTFGSRYVRLRTDARAETPQKIGALDKQGWAAYRQADQLYVKLFDYEAGATYPDYGCNVETYTNADYVELESLSPLRHLAAGATATHTERWHLFANVEPDAPDEASLQQTIEPLIAQAEHASAR
ncbi:MAG TPA: hypothetical protein VF525_04950 [Pyrinomonadaceae bacterium]